MFSQVQLFETPWTVAHQASLSITNSQSLFKLMSIELVMPCNHLILCHPLFLLPSIFPSISVFSNSTLRKLFVLWLSIWTQILVMVNDDCHEMNNVIAQLRNPKEKRGSLISCSGLIFHNYSFAFKKKNNFGKVPLKWTILYGHWYSETMCYIHISKVL